MAEKVSVRDILEQRRWLVWICAHLPDAKRVEDELPILKQNDYPAYQLEAVDLVEARKRLLSLLFDAASARYAAVLLGSPLPLAYWVKPDDVDKLLIETGRRDEFLCLVSLEPLGKILVEHPLEENGIGPFWLRAAGGLEPVVSRFAEFFPGGSKHRSTDMSPSRRERSG